MAKQLSLAHLIVLAAAGSAAFYGSNRLAARDAFDDVAQPALRAGAGRGSEAASAATAAPAPTQDTAPTPAAATTAAPGPENAMQAASESAPGDWAPGEAPSIAATQVADASATAPAPERPRAVASPLRAAIEVDRKADAFQSMTWTPPPPPPAPPAPPPPPPPPPSAPPLPFKFVGMLEQRADQPTAFLAKGDALHIVKAGDVVDGTYRVESLTSTQIVVTYLPLNQRQTLVADGGPK